MNRYQVMLSPDLEETYKMISEQLNMSMEQVLSSAIQLYAESLTLQVFDSICNAKRVQEHVEQSRKAAAQ